MWLAQVPTYYLPTYLPNYPPTHLPAYLLACLLTPLALWLAACLGHHNYIHPFLSVQCEVCSYIYQVYAYISLVDTLYYIK